MYGCETNIDIRGNCSICCSEGCSTEFFSWLAMPGSTDGKHSVDVHLTWTCKGDGEVSLLKQTFLSNKTQLSCQPWLKAHFKESINLIITLQLEMSSLLWLQVNSVTTVIKRVWRKGVNFQVLIVLPAQHDLQHLVEPNYSFCYRYTRSCRPCIFPT